MPNNDKGHYLRNNNANDKDEIRSVISQARSLISEGKIQGSQNVNAANQTGKIPTSAYHCSQCHFQLFTNLDINIHEPKNQEDQDDKKS